VPEWAKRLPESRRQVRADTVRTAGVCVHFWALFLAFFVGLVLARGDGFVSQFVGWFRAQWTKE